MKKSLKELKRKRADLVAKLKAITAKEAEMPDDQELDKDDVDQFSTLQAQIEQLDQRISRVEAVLAAEADDADPAGDDDKDGDDDDDDTDKSGRVTTHGSGRQGKGQLRSAGTRGERKPEKGLVVAGLIKMLVVGGGSRSDAREAAKSIYGEQHPVTKALAVSTGAGGGFIVPPDYVAELIELLRAKTVVRKAGPRVLPMPRGTMTMPRQNQAATAGYGAELASIPTSQQSVDQIVATYKKLTALVPVSNDLLRYSDPAIDAIVRDDLVQVFARREDLAFIRGDGTQDSPKGFLNFALSSQTIASNPTYTYTTAAQEIGGLINKLETANVPIDNPAWIMSPRSKNYLYNVQNSIGAYIYQEEMSKGTLLGIPFFTSTQIPTNLVVGGNTDCSEVYLVEMSQAMIFDSMTLELSVSREATYVDGSGNTVSTFQQDQTLVRAISEHDFQMRHQEAIALATGVRWAPAIQ
jgi:HK97 family phage major capsid protein